MYSRPKPGETEDDLLRLQDEYFENKVQNKVKLAATLVKSSENDKDLVKTSQEPSTSIQDQLANTFESIPSCINLGKIVEKQDTNPTIKPLKFSQTRGFPQAKRREENLENACKTGSLFSQQMKKFKPETKMEVDQPPPIRDKIFLTLPSKSYILTGQNSEEIHKENLNLLSGLSEKEILEEREKLLSTLDPALISFLKSRRRENPINEEKRNKTILEQNVEEMAVEDVEILQKENAEKWLNFDVVETSKLAWMKDLQIPMEKKEGQFEARFDFDGFLLPFSQPEITEKNRSLYHHGEEPGRPGYTLQELFQLSRSTVLQQKIIALNCIANILSTQQTGVYDKVLDLPLEQIFFVLRFCLDDNQPSILSASIKAMRNLIFYKIDETLLDNLLGFGLGRIQPILAVDQSEDDPTTNDQQLAESNLIKCLVRTDIFTRLKYIISTIQPQQETIIYAIEILTRLSRDSQLTMTKLFNYEGLITATINYEKPLQQTIKLLRVLSSRSEHISRQLLTKQKIFETLFKQVFFNNKFLKLQTETLHLWNVFLHYNLSLDYFNEFQPVILSMLDFHYNNTNLNERTSFVLQSHVASILIFLKNISLKLVLSEDFKKLIEKCSGKWSKQFAVLQDFSCGKLQIIASLCYYFNNLDFDEEITSILQSTTFTLITTNLRNGSMLLNNFETHKTTQNLKTLEGSVWDSKDHIVPILQSDSCIPFLCCLARTILSSKNLQIKKAFLQHENIEKYLQELQAKPNFFLTNNWFTRAENSFLMDLLKMSIQLKSQLKDSTLFFELSVKTLSTFNAQQTKDIEFILQNLIFSTSFYPNEALLKNLSLNSNQNLDLSLQNLTEISLVYSQVLNLKNEPNFTSNCSLDCSLGNIIPIDWIYTPIIVLYSNQTKNTKVEESHQKFVIKNCLKWILIYENYFPSLALSINPTDRFCRLSCVFLGSDSLFLIEEIHFLLESCFKNVLKHEEKLNFKKEIQGLNNFQDFYTQLLEQYQGVSYGDVLFGNVILVPLAQRHALQLRKTLWSEYMGVVQTFNVTREQMMGNFELYLEPTEEDLSLLQCYRRAIVNNTIRKQSVLYEIAQEHVRKYVISIKNK